MSHVPSWSKLGRNAEVEVAILLGLFGWNVKLSPGSRGPADLLARRKSDKWLIQVKSSRKFGRLKGLDLKKLKDLAVRTDGLPVLALVRPRITAMTEAKKTIPSDHIDQNTHDNRLISETTKLPAPSFYEILFHSLVDWTIKEPF